MTVADPGAEAAEVEAGSSSVLFLLGLLVPSDPKLAELRVVVTNEGSTDDSTTQPFSEQDEAEFDEVELLLGIKVVRFDDEGKDTGKVAVEVIGSKEVTLRVEVGGKEQS